MSRKRTQDEQRRDGAFPEEYAPPVPHKVGYCNPPLETRFKAGVSGNPPGRPKGAKAVDQVLRQALNRKVTDPRRGGRHKVSMLELIIEGLVLSAARRDPRMIRLLVALMDRFTPPDALRAEPIQMDAGDREILEEYVATFTEVLDREEGAP